MVLTKLLENVLSIDSPIIIEENQSITRSEITILKDRLSNNDFHVASIEYDASYSELSLIDQIDREFCFPDYFGRNWNAVDECLSDLSWLPSKAFCCFFIGSSQSKKEDKRIYDLLIDIFKCAGNVWKERGVIFKLICLSEIKN